MPTQPIEKAVIQQEATRLNELYQKIETLANTTKATGREAVLLAIEAGRALIEVKKQVGHGNFMLWVEANLTFTERTAQRYIRLAESNPTHVSDLEGPSSFSDAITVRQAYVAAGILPAPEPPPHTGEGKTRANPFDWYRHIDALVKELNYRDALDDADRTALRQLHSILLRLMEGKAAA